MSKIIVNQDNVITHITNNAVYAKVVGEGDGAHLGECVQAEATHIFMPEENMAMMVDMGIIVDVQTIPEGVIANQYKYVDGQFVINEAYTPYVSDAERIAALEDMVNMLLIGGNK